MTDTTTELHTADGVSTITGPLKGDWAFTKSNANKELVICYHANCMDGILSADLAKGYMPDAQHCFMLPISYDGKLPFKPEMHPGAVLMFVDFCPMAPQIVELVTKYHFAKVVIYDHHETRLKEAKEAAAIINSAKHNTELEIVFAEAKSGVGVTMSQVRPKGMLTRLLKTAQSYDLFLHSGKSNSEESYLAAVFTYWNNEVRPERKKLVTNTGMGYWARLRAETKLSQRLIDGLTVNPYHQVMDAGRILVEKNQLEIRKLVNETVVRTVETPLVATPEGFTRKSYNFHLVKAEGQYANDVAAMIALEDRYSVAVLIWEARSGGYKISGRSAALKIFALNKAFQEVEPTAGGHAFSAGMLTKIEPIDVLAKVIERFNGDLFFSRLLEEETKTHETVNV